MTTLLSDEQLLLRQSARAVIEAEYPTSWTRAWTEANEARRHELHDSLWRKFAELGWLGIAWPEECGGAGLGFVEQSIVLQELGRSLLPSAYLSTLVAGSLVARAGGARKEEILQAACRGESILTIALAEECGENPADFTTRSSKSGGGLELTGTKFFVPDASLANYFIVAARDDEKRLTWILADATDAGISLAPLETMDATRPLFRVTFDKTPAELLATSGNFDDVWDSVEPLYWAALAAEAVGGCEKTLEDAVAYAKERVQFGAPIGANQAIKHKCANMLIRAEGARAITYHAARCLDRDGEEARLACSMAKAYAVEAFREIAGEGIQIHGGVGFTWEFDCHLFYKRARAVEITAGHPDEHRERVAAGAGL